MAARNKHSVRTKRALFGMLVLFVGLQPVQAEKVKWRKSMAEALHESNRVKKPVLMTVTATWCGYCKKMMSNTFSDANVARQINQSFVPVIVDAEKQLKVADAFGVESFPTTIIISADLKVVKRIVGYYTAKQLSQKLAEVRKPTASTAKSPTPIVRPALLETPAVLKSTATKVSPDDQRVSKRLQDLEKQRELARAKLKALEQQRAVEKQQSVEQRQTLTKALQRQEALEKSLEEAFQKQQAFEKEQKLAIQHELSRRQSLEQQQLQLQQKALEQQRALVKQRALEEQQALKKQQQLEETIRRQQALARQHEIEKQEALKRDQEKQLALEKAMAQQRALEKSLADYRKLARQRALETAQEKQLALDQQRAFEKQQKFAKEQALKNAKDKQKAFEKQQELEAAKQRALRQQQQTLEKALKEKNALAKKQALQIEKASERERIRAKSQSVKPQVLSLPRPKSPWSFQQKCLVRIRDSGKLQNGDPQFAVTHRGVRICFASKELKKRFLADTDRYWPMYGGRCPVSATPESDHSKQSGEPLHAVVYRGKLWLFANQASEQLFSQNPEAYTKAIKSTKAIKVSVKN